MNSLNQKIKIATILPYKENYTYSSAQAAAIWVCDFFKYSKYNNDNFIFGNTQGKDYLTKNYINIPIQFKKSKFVSTTREYCQNFIKKIKNDNFEIIEIHNRPQILNILKKEIKTKFILYFHNDPLSMKGSKTSSERLNLLNSADKIIFVSQWTRKRFFNDLDKKLIDKSEVVYPSIHKSKKIYKKNKNIVFVGKLNKSKGYDIFGKAVINTLNKYPNWKAIVIGDEPREKIIFNHIRFKILGFLDHKKVSNWFKKSHIAVICSRWNEPFGRTALEATSNGCAVIISNKGGLPEAAPKAIKINNLNVNSVKLAIERLIKNKKLRTNLQKKCFKNFYLTNSLISKKIDNYRNKLIKF